MGQSGCTTDYNSRFMQPDSVDRAVCSMVGVEPTPPTRQFGLFYHVVLGPHRLTFYITPQQSIKTLASEVAVFPKTLCCGLLGATGCSYEKEEKCSARATRIGHLSIHMLW